MNIVLVSSEFPHSRYAATGGIGTYIQNLVFALTSFGHQVFLLTNAGKDISYFRKNVTLINVTIADSLLSSLEKYLPFLRRIIAFVRYPILFNVGVCLALKNLTRKVSIDIIEGSDFGGELFLYLLLTKIRPPVVLRLHTPSFIIRKLNNEKDNLFYKVLKLFEIYSLQKADSLYSPSKALAQIISKQLKLKVKTVIPYPFVPIISLKGHSQNNNLILYVGKIQVKKGVFDITTSIAQVINKLPRTRLIFAGPDTLYQGKSVKKLLIDKLKQLNVLKNITILDNINKKALYNLYRKSAITLIPSRWENFPHCALEAMSQGSLVLAAPQGGLKEIVDNNKTGILVDTRNSKMLTNTIINLLHSKTIRVKLTAEAKKVVEEKYNLKKIGRFTLKYYQKVISSA